MQSSIEHSHLSMRRRALEHGASHSSVKTILHTNKLKSSRIYFVEEPSEDNFNCRVEYYYIVMRKLDKVHRLKNIILLVNKATDK